MWKVFSCHLVLVLQIYGILRHEISVSRMTSYMFYLSQTQLPPPNFLFHNLLQDLNIINTTGASSRARTAYHIGTPGFSCIFFKLYFSVQCFMDHCLSFCSFSSVHLGFTILIVSLIQSSSSISGLNRIIGIISLNTSLIYHYQQCIINIDSIENILGLLYRPMYCNVKIKLYNVCSFSGGQKVKCSYQFKPLCRQKVSFTYL